MGDSLLSWYLIISFVVFLFVDYRTIYNFLDSKLLYTTSGSKINYESKNEGNTLFNELFRLSYIDLLILFFIALIFYLVIFGISSYIFGITPLYLNIGYKIINLSVLFSNKFNTIKFVYNISGLVFSYIIVWNFKTEILLFIKRNIKEVVNDEKIEEKQVVSYDIAYDENGECISILEDALYQNVLISGSIGSGKTSGAISRLIYPLLKSGKSGLILDVKGNFVDRVEEMCKRCGRITDLKIISKGSSKYFEILSNNTSSLELAGRIKQILELLSTNNNSDSYWLDKVENFLTNIFVLMKYLNKFNMLELHRLVVEEKYLKECLNDVKESVLKSPPKDKLAFEITNMINFFTKEFEPLDSRIKGIIKSEITRFTIPLVTEYDVYNQFCDRGRKELITFNEKSIVVLSVPIGENRTLSKILATILKLEFQKHVLSNISNPIPLFFIADEFQEFCNVADSNFLSLSREAKCINIISTQSYSSLKSTLKSEDHTRVIIQNLVNKIWFRNDDIYTVSEVIKQLGKTNIVRENKSVSESSTESKKYMFKEGFKNTKSSISKTLNYVETKENEYDENFFTRELKTFEALVLFIGKEGMKEPKKVMFKRWK